MNLNVYLLYEKKTSFPLIFYKESGKKPFSEMCPKEAWVISL